MKVFESFMGTIVVIVASCHLGKRGVASWSLSRFSPQILAPFSSSSAANPRFSNFSTDEDEFDETDGSAVYRHTLLTQRPSTVEWTPNLVNSISFIGTVDRCPIIYRNVGGNFGCYTMLYARNPHDSNRCFRSA
ncbi:unnamed protein product [Dovyalis caffra]|uniref:Uncharacterized protein n=1 Tax=Dovyalis caffra TaxID=77055 RepID=A0AAV1S868_9ROSI|nr:unnamed protein product [Dovyalis caffra]